MSQTNEHSARSRHVPLIISVAGCVVAVLSMFVAVQSCRISRRDVALSQRQFYGERLPIWRAQIDEQNEYLSVSATDDAIAMQYAVVHFPRGIDSPRTLKQPDCGFPLANLREGVQNHFMTKCEAPEDYTYWTTDGFVPIVLDAQYTAQGAVFSDISVYLLWCSITPPEKKSQKPTVVFTGTRFAARWRHLDDALDAMNALWTSEGVVIQAPSPTRFPGALRP